jgi:hypothetical protein
MRAIERSLEAVSLVAIAVWLGGFATIGAVVAPLVFGIVPAPASADAMTAVFRRFDSVAVACAVIALLVEIGHALLRPVVLRRDMVRAAMVVLAGAFAVVEALVVSPHIEELHREGAIRGLGDLGMELDRVHHLAEQLAKGELAILLVVLSLHAFRPATDYAAATSGAPLAGKA